MPRFKVMTYDRGRWDGLEPRKDHDDEVAQPGPDREDRDRGARPGQVRARFSQP